MIIYQFPTWEEIKKENDVFIKQKQYKGHSVDIPLCISNVLGIDLHILIECQNEQFIFKNYNGRKAENIIRFALCNKAGFAIASHRYVYSEDGYETGLDYLRFTMKDIYKELERFLCNDAVSD